MSFRLRALSLAARRLAEESVKYDHYLLKKNSGTKQAREEWQAWSDAYGVASRAVVELVNKESA